MVIRQFLKNLIINGVNHNIYGWLKIDNGLITIKTFESVSSFMEYNQIYQAEIIDDNGNRYFIHDLSIIKNVLNFYTLSGTI